MPCQHEVIQRIRFSRLQRKTFASVFKEEKMSSTENFKLYSGLKESKFGEYRQNDRDLIMDKVRIVYGENASDDLKRAYQEWCSRSPAAANGYLMAKLGYKSKVLTPSEMNLVFTCVSIKNQCNFCINSHSNYGRNYLNWQNEDIHALQNEQHHKLSDKRMENLSKAVYFIMNNKGILNDDNRKYLYSTLKLTESEVMEIAFNIGLATMSNYMNHVSNDKWINGSQTKQSKL